MRSLEMRGLVPKKEKRAPGSEFLKHEVGVWAFVMQDRRERQMCSRAGDRQLKCEDRTRRC